MRKSFAHILLMSFALVFVRAEEDKKDDPAEHFRKEIKPILQKHCYDCHDADVQKGDLNLAQYEELDQVKTAPEIWQIVYERVHAFEMPPKGKKDLSFDKQRKMVRFLRGLPRPDDVDCDQIASDRTANFYPGYVMSRRLNRAEYRNTIRDLFGVDLALMEEILPADGGGGEGFDTTGNALFTSSIHIEKYLSAADQVLATVLPVKAKGASPEVRKARKELLLGKANPKKAEARETAKQVVARTARLAFRRPVEDGEVEKYMAMFDRAWERGDGYVPSVRLALKGLLISPHFLFLVEPEPDEKGVQPLAALPLASKLSYFLWSSMPDEELLALAESDRLLDMNVYLEQIRRMLADPKAEALGERFALQWLDVERLGGEVRPNAEKFPEFDHELLASMKSEVSAAFNYVFREDRSLLELIDSDYTFVNERLAGIYDLEGVKGDELRKVQLSDRNRGGVVGMAAVHALTSYPLRTSPVLRGKWVLESLLGERVKPPPPGVPALEEEGEKAKTLTLREQLELHRENPDCASCHDKMDPLGFGMENFDVLGRWREEERGLKIDSSGTLPSGKSFTGPVGLKTVLMERKEDVLKLLVRKMVGYAYGRELTKFDSCVVDKAMEHLEKNGYRASILIEQIALSTPFRHRFYPKQET